MKLVSVEAINQDIKQVANDLNKLVNWKRDVVLIHVRKNGLIEFRKIVKVKKPEDKKKGFVITKSLTQNRGFVLLRTRKSGSIQPRS